MAQGTQAQGVPESSPQGNPVPAPETAAIAFAKAADAAGYTVHNGSPLIGVSGDTGDGFLVPLTAPEWFSTVPANARSNVFRALASHALRVGQAKVKAAETPTRETAIEGANSALNGSYSPSRERGNDIVASESARMFADHVRKLVLAKKADASEAMIEATIAAQAETDAGKTLLARFRGEIVERGTYAVTRKGKGSKADAMAIDL